MFPNMNIISTIYYHVTTFIHILYTIFLLRLFHVNITAINIHGCTCSITSIHIIVIKLSSTLSYARPLTHDNSVLTTLQAGLFSGRLWKKTGLA